MIATLLVATPIFFQASPRVLHLADAERVALEHQPAMQQARAQTNVAEARATTARAPLFPQLTATAQYQRARGSSLGRGVATTPTSGAGSGAPGGVGGGTTTAVVTTSNPTGVDLFSFGATATQLIWDFGKTYEQSRAANRLVLSARAQQRVTSQNVVLDVRRAYFAARAQKALVVVATDTLANQQRHLEQVEGFVKVGTRPEIDLAQARTDVANSRVQVINAENAYALAKAELARAIGEPAAADFDVADDELPPVDGEELPAEKLNEKALRERPELTALTRQLEGQKLVVRGLEGGYGPSLSAHGSYQQIGTALDNLGPAWSVGVTLAWPIFQGGLTKGQVREAEANIDVTNAQLNAQKLQIAVDVQQSQLLLRAAKATEEATKEVVNNAKERLRLAEGRYAQGVGSIIELGDAQVAMTQANALLVQAKFNVSSARADLLAAMGQR